MSGYTDLGMGPPMGDAELPGEYPDDPAAAGSAVDRNPPEPAPRRQALVEEWLAKVEYAKKKWKPKFDKMRADASFAQGNQWNTNITANDPNADAPETRYVANIIQRHIQQRVSGLYAKNPRFVAQRRRRLNTAVWDGSPQTLEMAKQAMVMALGTGQPIDPTIQAILADASAAVERMKLVQRVCKTLELQLGYEVSQTVPGFKMMMKATVRRAVTTGLGWVKLCYYRPPSESPEPSRVADTSNRLALLQQIAADLADERINMEDSDVERMRLALEGMKAPQQYVKREGLAFDWPGPTSLIPDPNMIQLRGFLGCGWVAQQYALPPERIQQIYGKDVTSSYRAYSRTGLKDGSEQPERSRNRPGTPTTSDSDDAQDNLGLVYEIWCIEDGLVYVVCDGYPDFLREPAPPEYFTERFWPWFLVAFNEMESEDNPWPLSDVELLRHPQLEINRARQGLREHRRANRPKIITGEDTLDEDDESKLMNHPANAVISLRGLQPGQRVEDLLQAFKGPPIDSALYDVNPAYDDVLRVAGSQEADLGGTSGSTATETAIAENSRTSAMSSAIDDLDDMLSDLAAAAGQMLLAEMPALEVQRTVGPGAVWPDLSVDNIAAEVFLQIEAGSTGRPNRAARIGEFERIAPVLLQVPGVRPEKLAEYALSLMADNLEVSDFLDPQAPSISSMNAAKPDNGMAAQPGQEPDAQANQGSMNTPKAKQQAQMGPRPPDQPPTPVYGPAKGMVN